MTRARAITLLLPVLLIANSARAAPPAPIEHMYILSFNSSGELTSPGELELAVQELEKAPVDRVLIFSYGWGTDGEQSYAEYRKIVGAIYANVPAEERKRNLAVIAVGWDSSQTGFKKLFNNILPLPLLANGLAWLPDRVLFPISFWSKAAQADRIGFGGLRTALNRVFKVWEGRDPHPDVILVGHSFGTRVLSALMVNKLGLIRVGGEEFDGASHVAGAAMMQPALVSANLDHGAGYPVLVTMSRHDRALGFLYPIANLPLNAYGFTLFEAFVQRWVFRPVEATASAAGSRIPGRGQKAEQETDPATPIRHEQGTVGATFSRTKRMLGEIIAIPLSLAFTLATVPISYVYVQTRGLVTRPVGHLADTLAQIPIVEIPVEGTARLLGMQVLPGQRSRGLFTLGPIHDALGRMEVDRLLQQQDPILFPSDLDGRRPPDGVTIVDSSNIIKRGMFGVNYENPLADWTLGWLDPIGAHGDYTNEEAVHLMRWMAQTRAQF